MNRLFAAPVTIDALLLLLAAAAGLGWIWLRAGGPEHMDQWNIAVLLIPIALLGVAVLSWGDESDADRATVWVAILAGGFLPLLFALHASETGSPGSTESKAMHRSPRARPR